MVSERRSLQSFQLLPSLLRLISNHHWSPIVAHQTSSTARTYLAALRLQQKRRWTEHWDVDWRKLEEFEGLEKKKKDIWMWMERRE
ncbi:unnamed protein product [Caenorhabditis nigoni]